MLIAQLMRYAMTAFAMRSLETVLRDWQPSEQACRKLANEIDPADLVASWVKTVKGERALGLWVFNLVRSSKDPARAASDLSELNAEPGILPARPLKSPPKYSLLVERWLAVDELAYLDAMARVVEQAPRPYREVAATLPPAEEQPDWSGRWSLHFFTETSLSGMSLAPRVRDRAIANLGLDQIALLLKAYRASHGEYPKSLAELAKYAGRALPEDPFSGKPFVYHRDGSGFVVYSWGLNLKDDRGTPQSFQGRKAEGDIVVRCVR
jgi:hypothetical protein